MCGIDYIEIGSGATILFVPGSYSTHAAWRPVQKLIPTYRMVGTSLCGYGTTIETRTPDDFDMRHEVRVVEEAARRAGGPVHLVGHSFGATVALAAALGDSVDIASLTLFEANPLALLKGHPTEMLYREAHKLSSELEAAVHAGEADAPARIIDFWGGHGAFAAMPEVVRNYCRETAPANILDWRTAFGFHAGIHSYAALDIPILLVRGALANPAMVAMTEVLERSLPRARSAAVPGAGHFLITSHPMDCATLLTTFMSKVGEQAERN